MSFSICKLNSYAKYRLLYCFPQKSTYGCYKESFNFCVVQPSLSCIELYSIPLTLHELACIYFRGIRVFHAQYSGYFQSVICGLLYHPWPQIYVCQWNILSYKPYYTIRARWRWWKTVAATWIQLYSHGSIFYNQFNHWNIDILISTIFILNVF